MPKVSFKIDGKKLDWVIFFNFIFPYIFPPILEINVMRTSGPYELISGLKWISTLYNWVNQLS